MYYVILFFSLEKRLPETQSEKDLRGRNRS